MMILNLLLSLAAAWTAPPPLTTVAPVTVVLVDALPAPGARAAVLRRSRDRGDVVLLPPGAATEDLAAALSLLADARRRDGPAAFERDAVLVVKTASLSQPLTAAQRQRLRADLDRLRGAPVRVVVGVGSARAIDVSLRSLR